jgi:hypothetical protein
MSSVVISGDTSGAITLSAPAVAGTNTITLPAATGTAVVTGTTPTLNGITFPATQVPSADANTLDDYEEGTWTPTITTNSGTATTYSDLSGRYTRIGNTVYIRGGVRPTNGTFGAGSAEGTLYVDEQSGSFTGENLNATGALAQSNVCTVAGDSSPILKGLIAKSCLITTEDQAANVTWDGSLPTQTNSTNHGINVPANSSYVLNDINNIKNIYVHHITS